MIDRPTGSSVLVVWPHYSFPGLASLRIVVDAKKDMEMNILYLLCIWNYTLRIAPLPLISLRNINVDVLLKSLLWPPPLVYKAGGVAVVSPK